MNTSCTIHTFGSVIRIDRSPAPEWRPVQFQAEEQRTGKLTEQAKREIQAKHPHIEACRSPVAGSCVDIDGDSWHKDGQRCDRCGFGIDAAPGTNGYRGYWGEPIT